MNFSSSPPISAPIPSTDIWIGDLLFRRHNCSLKYARDGTLMMVPDPTELARRLWLSLGWLLAHSLAIALNFAVLLMSMNKPRRQAYHKKLQFLLGSLAFCNIVLALGFLAYTLLLHVFYDMDSFDTLLHLPIALRGPSIWHFAKFLIHTELVENFLLAQQLVLLLASLDRYLALFDRYCSDAKSPKLWALITIIPYVIALAPLDRNLMELWMSEQKTNLMRFLAPLSALLLSLVFSGTSLLVLLLHLRSPPFRPLHQLSFTLSLLAILLVDSFAKFGLFSQLLCANLGLHISSGDIDSRFGALIDTYHSVSHCVLMGSPLINALITLAGVDFYRNRVSTFLHSRCCCCSPTFFPGQRPPLDYASETMRSIIADQTRARRIHGMRTLGKGIRRQ